MRSFCAVMLAGVLSVSAIGQSFDFECHSPGPLPNDPSMSCDGVASNNLGSGSGVMTFLTCSFPTSGSQYLSLFAAGPLNATPGGPIARPISASATEVRIPIPAGASTISMSWDFFNAEGGPQANYNDGMSIDIVDANGASLGNLAYADTHTPTVGSATCGLNGEIGPAGPKTILQALPAMTPCAYLSIVVWNGSDNSVPSQALVDNIVFDTSLPGCAVPCIAVMGVPTLTASSPFGIPGSLQVNMSSLPPGGTYLLAATLNGGTYPNGWFYGVDIPVSELGVEINFGWPFSGPISSAPCTSGTAVIGPIFGAPSAMTLFMVALGIPNATIAGSPTLVTNAVSYTIP